MPSTGDKTQPVLHEIDLMEHPARLLIHRYTQDKGYEERHMILLWSHIKELSEIRRKGRTSGHTEGWVGTVAQGVHLAFVWLEDRELGRALYQADCKETCFIIESCFYQQLWFKGSRCDIYFLKIQVVLEAKKHFSEVSRETTISFVQKAYNMAMVIILCAFLNYLYVYMVYFTQSHSKFKR